MILGILLSRTMIRAGTELHMFKGSRLPPIRRKIAENCQYSTRPAGTKFGEWGSIVGGKSLRGEGLHNWDGEEDEDIRDLGFSFFFF